MVDGRDYNHAFDTLYIDMADFRKDADGLRAKLIGLEFILWDVIRDFMLYTSIFLVAPPLIILHYFMRSDSSALSFHIVFVVFGLVLVLATYGLMRFLFYYLLTRHIRRRKFGRLGSLEHLSED